MTEDSVRDEPPSGADSSSTEDMKHQRRFDPATDQPSMVVVDTVSVVSGTPMESLPLLQGAVDADALDKLVDGSQRRLDGICVSFTYADHEVTVHGSGLVSVEETTR